MKTKSFLIKVPENIWNKWKDTIPRSKSLHNALLELLEKESKK
tara:strand:- start:260 stop:388 length:129 start_codon:yes stop_codon:yes gene_type:complete